MISDRMAEILRRLRTDAWPDAVADAAGPLGVEGISVCAAGRPGVSEILWSSGGVADDFEDLQVMLGEGPGRDSLTSGAVVRVPDLARVREDRWPALLTEASDLAVQAVFCFPLRIGAITLGVLTLFRRVPGPLTSAQGEDAGALAAALTHRVLDLGLPLLSSPEGADLPHHHAVLHQATGMVSVQLEVPLAEALLRLRAHAYSNSLNLTETARDIVARRLRLAPEPHPTGGVDEADED
ncbi:ANTAR domain-containing protein [Streptomyces sp. NPDC007084]|uniref:ANTAR domain-containing protein n=1 Tax=Streptomyces sp. NPDC007084 TaxID=3154313 RepID=UPI0034564110